MRPGTGTSGYFHSERDAAGLTRVRRELTRQLWHEWSPLWSFSDATFEANAALSTPPTSLTRSSTPTGTGTGSTAGDPAYEQE